jgi:hypothetical protein
MSGPPVPDSYRALIDSSRVSTGTREALKAREAPDDPAYQPMALTSAQLTILRAAIGRVLPQPKEARIDVAARLDAQLHAGQGDGWRFAKLPDDLAAYARGLSVLESEARTRHGQGFADLTDSLQDELLARTASGELDGAMPELLDGAQMQLWFEDLCSDAVRLYVSHPATLARIFYSGIAYGGDGDNKPGFTLIGLGEHESWEPMPETGLDRR